MDTEDFFAVDYAGARRLFMAQCHALGAPVRSYLHPDLGPDGMVLFTDAVRIGPADARRCLIIVSGTHGVEGYAGSGCQVGLLSRLPALPPDLSIVFIHMLNAWGAAWRRRHNEDNIDLNRHFVDRAAPLPDNPAHRRLEAALLPRVQAAASRDLAIEAADAFRAEIGDGPFAQAIFEGQYSAPGGFGYGGAAESWSAAILGTILDDLVDAPEEVGLIDLHTGLGDFGVGLVISLEPAGSETTSKVRAWFQEPFVALLEDRGELPYRLQGDLANGVKRHFGSRAAVYAVSLEFGTFSATRFADLMVAEAWACTAGKDQEAEVEAIRCDLKHFFYPDSRRWRAMVAARSRQVVQDFIQGFGDGDDLDTQGGICKLKTPG